jgi:hypothetical protein
VSESHPSADAIKAAIFGWQSGDEAAVITKHVATCGACRPLAAADEQLAELLAKLPRYERPQELDPAAAVAARLASRPAARPRPRFVTPRWVAAPVAAILLVALLLGGALLVPDASAGAWLRSILIRQFPSPGEAGAPDPTFGLPSESPMRATTLDAAQRAVTFPVVLPAYVPDGFIVTGVTVFQAPGATAPTQVFITYARAGGRQPLTLTYGPAGSSTAVTSAPGAAHEMLVDGRRGVYFDDASAGLKTQGSSAEPLQLGRLIVERPEVLLIASGDRRDGLDADTLAAVLASIHA